MQYVLERRELGTRQCASDVRRSEQRGSKCALQSHAQETPPAAQPTLPGRGAQGGRSALGSEAHELSDQAKRLRTYSIARQLRMRGRIGVVGLVAAAQGKLHAYASQRQ